MVGHLEAGESGDIVTRIIVCCRRFLYGSGALQGALILLFIGFWALQGPEYYYLHGSGSCKAQNTIIYRVLGLARPGILLFIGFWALQGPEYYYLHGSGPCKARNTIIYRVLGLARPRILLFIG